MGDVVVVGQIARDLVLVVDEVPGPGGTAPVRERREALGGKGANIAVGLAQLGAPVALKAARAASGAWVLDGTPNGCETNCWRVPRWSTRPAVVTPSSRR